MVKSKYSKMEEHLVKNIDSLSDEVTEYMRYFLRLGLNPSVSKDIGIEELKTLLVELIEDKVNDLLDQKKDVDTMSFLNKNLTKKQIDNYKVKLKLAKTCLNTNDFTPFETEAKLTGTTSKLVVESIIRIGEKWEMFYETLTVKADSVRQTLIGNIDNLSEEDPVFNRLKVLESPITLDEFITTLLPIEKSKVNNDDIGVDGGKNGKVTGVDFNPEDE